MLAMRFDASSVLGVFKAQLDGIAQKINSDTIQDAVIVRTTRIKDLKRSLVKAFGWRVTAGFITFCSSMYFIGNMRTAFMIVASDFLSKSATMFFGERLFNKVKIGRTGSGESLSRSIAKALIWRAVAFVNTAVVSGAIVGNAGVGSLIALSDSIFKTSLMVVYDQFWNRIDWGKELENVDGDGI